MAAVPGPYDATRDRLADLMADQPSYRVEQVWRSLHVNVRRPAEMTELPAALRERLDSALPPALTPVAESVSDGGETVKWLFALHDGARVETVLMHYRDRTTVCVSSQAGCAMNCSFCATGQAGFTRQLTAGEIVEQVVAAMRQARAHPEGERRVSNIVFMGMGEPLANYDRLWAAITRLHDDIGISARHLTVSTVGVVPGIRRLATEALPVNLAVSLHAANDRLREKLVPLNRRYPLSVLTEACRSYLAAKGRRLSFEWALIDGVNDSFKDAAELADIAVPLGAHVNLIPLNPTPGYAVMGSSPGRVRQFRDRLTDLGVNATIRRNRGTDIDAACGQLAART
ncbi:23S rRNA (adenine(2503)-C(2))-methyltransferase RlmN [Acidiferrimicrobium sp. IK]|uniref:23S rRNA (adenine(2503)-C(2))-methyltransferase RlmN n=1 Tax=Acidiferrimicrobium sp. IK TaxID=2871700 RepID=UPI003966C5ED